MTDDSGIVIADSGRSAKSVTIDRNGRSRRAGIPNKPSFEVDGQSFAVAEMLPVGFVNAMEMSAIDHLKMMAVVQPFIDSAISKTVKVPKDYPFEDFKELYLIAAKSKLKGLATYRPNDTLGSVLFVGVETPAVVAPAALVAVVPADIDPVRLQIEKRPAGDLQAISSKIEYWTQAGKKSLCMIVSFAPVTGIVGGESVTIERPVEFFIPAGQDAESSQWVSLAMRSFSLAARGGFISQGLRDMRKVTWDRGPVRCGVRIRMDGVSVPMTHDSEVAAIGYAIQQILVARGFLDADGNPVPASAIVAKAAQSAAPPVVAPSPAPVVVPTAATLESVQRQQLGKKCAECGAHAVVPRDGCEHCTACHTIGSCG